MLLARHALVVQRFWVLIRAIWVDIKTTTARVTGIDRELLWLAVGHDVGKDSFHTLLVKLIVLTERDKVTQQRFAIDLLALVLNLDAAPVRLIGDQTVRFQ